MLSYERELNIVDKRSGQDRHKPYIKIRENADTAILFVHGIYGSPVQFEQLAENLFNQGYTVMAVLLPGHGKGAKDFARSGSKEWYAEVSRAAASLRKNHRNIYMVGHSMGGLLSLKEGIANGVNGVVLISVPMKVKLSIRTISMSVRMLWGNPDKDDEFLKSYRYAYSVQKGSIWQYAAGLPGLIDVVKMTRSTRKALTEVDFPVLVIQSSRDETVSWQSVSILKRGLTSKMDTLLLEKSGHCYYHPEEIGRINDKVSEFIKTVTPSLR